MRKVSPPELRDDLPLAPLLEGIQSEIDFLEKRPDYQSFQFGEQIFSKADYLAGMRKFVETGKSTQDPKEFYRKIEEEFDFYEVYGQPDQPGSVFITAYYEAWMEGSLKPTEKFWQPVYRTPDDMMNLDLVSFDSKFAQERKLRGRIVDKSVLPYFSREDIDSKGALRGKNLELCYLDPLDAFFVQVEGSGVVDLGGGNRIRLNYADKNGHPYEAVGKYVKQFIPPDQLSLHSVENYLRNLPREEMQRYLNKNPSFVFFQLSNQSATTFLGVSAIDGRTIATDKRYFPKGAIAFLDFDQPKFANPETYVSTESERTSRFVLDQDIGGAIQGGGRVDLFWGRGQEAKRYAGVMKHSGKLYYLAPKKP